MLTKSILSIDVDVFKHGDRWRDSQESGEGVGILMNELRDQGVSYVSMQEVTDPRRDWNLKAEVEKAENEEFSNTDDVHPILRFGGT